MEIGSSMVMKIESLASSSGLSAHVDNSIYGNASEAQPNDQGSNNTLAIIISRIGWDSTLHQLTS